MTGATAVGVPLVRIPMSGRAKAAVTFIVLQLVATAAIGFAVVAEIGLLKRVQRGAFVTIDEVTASNGRLETLGYIFMISLLASGLTWLLWQHRAHRRVRDLGIQGLEFTPAWGAGWWFIPIGSLFMPYKAIKELWLASDPASPTYGWERTQRSLILPAWWATYLVAGILRFVASSMASEQTPEAFISRDFLWIIGLNLWIVAGCLAIAIVREIDRRQAVISSETSIGPDAPARPDSVPPPPPPPQLRRPRNRVLVAILVATAITALGVAGVLSLRNDNGSSVAAVSTSPSAPQPDPTATGTDPPSTPGHERYENAQVGYTLEYPDAWRISSESPNGRNVTLQRSFTTAMNVRVSKGVFGTPKQLLKAMAIAVKARTREFEGIAQNGERTVAGLPAASIEYVGRIPQVPQLPMHMLQVIVLDERTAFLFTYAATPKDFDRGRADAEAIMESLRVTA